MRTWPTTLGALSGLCAAALWMSSPGSAQPAAPGAHPSARLSARDAEARALLAKMTLEEKVGQMTQAEQLSDPRDVQTYFLGSVLSGGSFDPKAGNSLQAWTDVYDAAQKLAGTSGKTPRAAGGT